MESFNTDEKSLIKLAILLHSDLELPSNLTSQQKYYTDLIRDADMLENIRRLPHDLENITGYSKAELSRQEISTKVLEDLQAGRPVDNRNVKTGDSRRGRQASNKFAFFFRQNGRQMI